MRDGGWSIFLALVATLIAAVTWATGTAQGQPAGVLPSSQIGGNRMVPTSMGQMQLSFADVVKKTAPAVVTIKAKKIIRRPPIYDDPMYRRFFNIPDGPATRKVPSSLGSGVIVRADGVVITNHHVIADADEIVVVTNDKREFDAKVLLADEKTDLAILKINTGGRTLPTLRFHDSDDAQVGDLVLAIGNPYGVGQTVTSGIISALARTQVGVSDYQFFIQTDAAINPGNSGGALVTMDGALIGINTAIYSRTGGSIGIGFAIPANMVKLVADSAESGGKRIARPWIGISSQSVTSDIADSLGLDRPQGVLLQDVVAGSPAARAGLAQGDVVIKVDGFEVGDTQSMRYRLATKGVGKTAEISYLRNGKPGLAQVALVVAPEVPARDLTVIDGANPFNGSKVGNLNPGFADELGLDQTKGVVIQGIDRRSLAARVGFQPEDIILAVNGVKIADVDLLEAQLRQRPRAWEISLVRKERVLNVRLPPVR